MATSSPTPPVDETYTVSRAQLTNTLTALKDLFANPVDAKGTPLVVAGSDAETTSKEIKSNTGSEYYNLSDLNENVLLLRNKLQLNAYVKQKACDIILKYIDTDGSTNEKAASLMIFYGGFRSYLNVPDKNAIQKIVEAERLNAIKDQRERKSTQAPYGYYPKLAIRGRDPNQGKFSLPTIKVNEDKVVPGRPIEGATTGIFYSNSDTIQIFQLAFFNYTIYINNLVSYDENKFNKMSKDVAIARFENDLGNINETTPGRTEKDFLFQGYYREYLRDVQGKLLYTNEPGYDRSSTQIFSAGPKVAVTVEGAARRGGARTKSRKVHGVKHLKSTRKMRK